VALSYGLLIAEAPLSPTQRIIAQLLLTECSESRSPDEVGKSVPMTHKHITEIFRKFGVNSRARTYGRVARAEALRPGENLPRICTFDPDRPNGREQLS